MVVRGHIEKGLVVPDEPLTLADGTLVTIATVIDAPREDASESRRTLADRLRNVIGKAVDLPEDAALNHDFYLYGAPKK